MNLASPQFGSPFDCEPGLTLIISQFESGGPHRERRDRPPVGPCVHDRLGRPCSGGFPTGVQHKKIGLKRAKAREGRT